jgi:hypothetical protein
MEIRRSQQKVGELKIPDIGKTFFIEDKEYKVNYIKAGSGNFSADPYNTEGKHIPAINEKFMIDDCSYIVTYVHSTKKRITAQPLSSGY